MTSLALIAHDKKKGTIVDLSKQYKSLLSELELHATGTTGGRIETETGLDIDRKLSGREGGDVMIAAAIATGEIDAVVFLRDPLTAQPHEPDISALLRICDVHDIPLATTVSGAQYLLDGIAKEMDDINLDEHD